MGGTCSTHRRCEECIQKFNLKREGKRLFATSRRIGCEGTDWIKLAQDMVQ